MHDLTLTLPGVALATTRIPRPRMEAELKKELALQLYREGIVASFGACRIAGIEQAEFHYLLGERGIPQRYDVDGYRQYKEVFEELIANLS